MVGAIAFEGGDGIVDGDQVHHAFVFDLGPPAQLGGRPVADVVTLTTATGARVTWCYVTDPEGNAVELQSWS